MVQHWYYDPYGLHISNLFCSSPGCISRTYSYSTDVMNIIHMHCTYYLCNVSLGRPKGSRRRVKPCTSFFVEWPLVTRHPLSSRLGLTMPDEFPKSIEFLTVNVPPRTNWQGELPSLQPEKNTVLVSHGRPPWWRSFQVASGAFRGLLNIFAASGTQRMVSGYLMPSLSQWQVRLSLFKLCISSVSRFW